jgi:hypothetical protein
MARPRLTNETVIRKNIVLPNSTWKRIARFRFTHEIPSEMEAVRRLLNASLDRMGIYTDEESEDAA